MHEFDFTSARVPSIDEVVDRVIRCGAWAHFGGFEGTQYALEAGGIKDLPDERILHHVHPPFPSQVRGEFMSLPDGRRVLVEDHIRLNQQSHPGSHERVGGFLYVCIPAGAKASTT